MAESGVTLSKPTPRPWKITRKHMHGIVIYSSNPSWMENQEHVACVNPNEQGDVNAAHIVRCVNMHEDLVGALQLAWHHLQEGPQEHWMKEIVDVLAKAEGRDE
jgi:hypothetical protein